MKEKNGDCGEYHLCLRKVQDDRDELYLKNAKRYKNIAQEKIDWHKRIYFSAGLLLSQMQRRVWKIQMQLFFKMNR